MIILLTIHIGMYIHAYSDIRLASDIGQDIKTDMHTIVCFHMRIPIYIRFNIDTMLMLG